MATRAIKPKREDGPGRGWPSLPERAPSIIRQDAPGTGRVIALVSLLLVAMGVPDRKITIVHPAVDADRFHPRVASGEVRHRYAGGGRSRLSLCEQFRCWSKGRTDTNDVDRLGKRARKTVRPILLG